MSELEGDDCIAVGGPRDGRTFKSGPAMAYVFAGYWPDNEGADFYVWDKTYDAEGRRVYRPIKEN